MRCEHGDFKPTSRSERSLFGLNSAEPSRGSRIKARIATWQRADTTRAPYVRGEVALAWRKRGLSKGHPSSTLRPFPYQSLSPHHQINVAMNSQGRQTLQRLAQRFQEQARQQGFNSGGGAGGSPGGGRPGAGLLGGGAGLFLLVAGGLAVNSSLFNGESPSFPLALLWLAEGRQASDEPFTSIDSSLSSQALNRVRGHQRLTAPSCKSDYVQLLSLVL